MTIRIEKYIVPPEFIQAQLELMNKLGNDIRKKTEAPEGACAITAVHVIQGFIDSMKKELKIAVVEEAKEETTH